MSTFDDELAQEILKSEKLRVTILICSLATAVILSVILPLFLLEQFQRAFHGRFRFFEYGVILASSVTMIYLLVERALISRRIARGVKPRTFYRYLDALIEVSLPTIGFVGGALILGPVYSLVSPILLWYPIFILLSALRLDFRLCIFTGAVAAIEYLGVAVYYTNQPGYVQFEPILVALPQHLVKSILLFATGVATALVTNQIRKTVVNSFKVSEEHNRIRRTFGQYVSPEVMDKLLEQKADMRSEKRYVCVMFLDIRGFTRFAEKKTPEDVVAFLDSLFEFMIEIVNRNNGIINKFLGDGFMAVFGAPLSDGNESLRAVTAAKEILQHLDREIAEEKILPTSVGIGLHAGEAVTGSIGSAVRQEYTVIGDVVNLASRIEQLNKKFDSRLLVSEEVWRAVSESVSHAQRIGDTQVKGHDAPIHVYRLA